MRTLSLFLVWYLALPARAVEPPSQPRPSIVELSPPAPLRPTDTLTLDVGRYRWFGLEHYDGRVTWKIEGAGIDSFQTDGPTVLLGAAQGGEAIAPQKVPAKALVVWGTQSGNATIVAWGVLDGGAVELDRRKIAVGSGPPKPSPQPADPLSAKLQAAFVADGSPKECAAQLAAHYGAASRITVDDASLKTTGALLAELRRTANALCPLPLLKNVREIVADELDAKLGTNPAAPLDAAARSIAREQFARFAVLIGGLK